MDTILFDGDCAYCNGWVRWIGARQRPGQFRFLPLGSAEGLALRRAHGVPDHVDSIVLVRDGRAFMKSDAAWRVLGALPGLTLPAMLLRLVPRPLRELGYDLVARNRHRLGLKDECQIPGR